MWTDEITETMIEATDQPPFDLDLAPILKQIQHSQRRRRVTAVSGIVVVVAALVGAVIVVAPRVAHHDQRTNELHAPVHDVLARTKPISGTAARAAFASWGPTRGDLATNPVFINEVRREWANPSGPEFYQGRSRETGPVQVLFAGNTPDGPAAVAAQEDSNADTGVLVGVMTEIPGSPGLSLWGPNDPTQSSVQLTANLGRFDLRQVSFSTGSGRHVVVLPTDATDSVSASLTERVTAQGRVERSWQPVKVVDGVGVVTLAAKGSSWNTLFRIHHPGRATDEGPVWINVGRVPEPANALGFWTQINAVIGDASGGIGPNTYTSWLRRYGALGQPFGQSGWTVGGDLPDNRTLLVQQLWLLGQPAHTVVILQANKSSAVISDTVTVATARPILAVPLPDLGGWLVLAGPHSAVTGYRLPGAAAWTAPPRAISYELCPDAGNNCTNVYSRAAAVLPTLAPRIQIRLKVDGTTRTVTEPTTGAEQ
jgi:hypothetical protein